MPRPAYHSQLLIHWVAFCWIGPPTSYFMYCMRGVLVKTFVPQQGTVTFQCTDQTLCPYREQWFVGYLYSNSVLS